MVAPQPAVPVMADPAAAYRVAANAGAGPRISEITTAAGRKLAGNWCADLAASDVDSAMAAVRSQAPSIDAAYVAIFAIDVVCPELQDKAMAQTRVSFE
jgi:hypothetical protein